MKEKTDLEKMDVKSDRIKKEFQCSVSEYKTKESSDLRNHSLIHSEVEELFKCSQYPMLYLRENNIDIRTNNLN
ncbi:hypothetical protein Avbf_15022 [Armadillidium vulgare]|nr:hypothetical protein Avbf_15022 [Armadillidium vulgare]